MNWIPVFLLFISYHTLAQRSDFKHINLAKADSIAYVHQDENLSNLPVLTHKLTTSLTTDVEKFRAIYTWVSISIENDYSSYLTTKKKRKKLSDNQEALTAWNSSFTPKVFNNLLKHKKTACTGYAYLIRELAALAGINSKIVDGYGRTPTLLLDAKSIPNHSWNMVQLNGKWYLCDATWSAGKIIMDDVGTRFEQDYFDGYFLAEPELFIKNHYPLDLNMSLVTEPFTFNQFIAGPVIYKEAFNLNITPTLPLQMHSAIVKNEIVSFTFSVKDTFDPNNISLILSKGGVSKSVTPKVTTKDSEYILTHQFENAGSYDTHVKFGDIIVTSYVVSVKRK